MNFMIRHIFLATALAFCALASTSTLMAQTATAPAIAMTIKGGTYRLFVEGEQPTLQLSSQAGDKVQLVARDIFGQPTGWQRANIANEEIALPKTRGYYRIEARNIAAPHELRGAIDFAVIAPSRAGVRPDSFFASNTSQLRVGQELEFLQKIGMKVQRAHFQPRPTKVPATPDGAALPLDFSEQDRRWAEMRAHDSWVLPIAGYAFENTRSEMARKTDMHGPPRDFDEWVNSWQQILQHYPEISTYEFWNEPWIYGWTWAATPQSYRDLQTQWCRMALKTRPDLRIIAGNSSMFTEDHIEPFPAAWRGLLQGTSHHPYAFGTGEPTMRGGGVQRGIDHGNQVTRRMKLPFYYLTEGGTEYDLPATAAGPLGEGKNNLFNARKIVQYHVRAALMSAFMGNAQWNIGYGPEWTRSNAAYAWMTHLLEDRPIVADIWPQQPLLWGAIFAHPKFATAPVKALPRAAELATRWQVAIPAARAGDATKVAVIWSHTGSSRLDPDRNGTIALKASGLRAFDMTGREILARGDNLTLPFGEDPIYITSETLDVVQLRARIAQARIQNVTPLNMYPLGLMAPTAQKQTVKVRLQNQLNRTLSGTLSLRVPGLKTIPITRFSLPPAALQDISLTWPGLPNASNVAGEYPVVLSAVTPAGTVQSEHRLQVARFARRTIAADGTLDDWRGIAPVTVDSVRQNAAPDMTQFLLNPNLKPPTNDDKTKRVRAQVYTAYDERNVYIAAAVQEPSFGNAAGGPVKKGEADLPYRLGMPDGLEHVRLTGDAFAFAFGFRPRVPGWGRQMDDAYAWKGHFYDTDYQYVAHISTDGPLLMRQWGPQTTRRTAYQTVPVPGYEPVKGATIAIRRDENAGQTIYEIAIPRREMALFDPQQETLRFDFLLPNNEKLGHGGALQWAQEVGVFDYWYSSGSYSPSWMQNLPAQTFFGIEK